MDIDMNAQCNSLMSDNSYIAEDGLPHCKGCGELLVTENVVKIFNRHMPVMCKCRRDELKRQEEEREIRNKMEMVNKLRRASLLGERYKDTSFDTTENTGESFRLAMERCKRYCRIASEALSNGYGMYIYGGSGVGKTHLTACMCNDLISQYKQCLFTSFFEISKLIRATFSFNSDGEEMVKRICDVDFLFLDDIGTERVKKNGEDSWLQEQVYDIINKRYNNRKPTVFTSNYSLNELITERGLMEKTVDRITEMSTAVIKVSGTSYRQKNIPTAVPF